MDKKVDQHEARPCKHYEDVCFLCGMKVENEIHDTEIRDQSFDGEARDS